MQEEGEGTQQHGEGDNVSTEGGDVVQGDKVEQAPPQESPKESDESGESTHVEK